MTNIGEVSYERSRSFFKRKGVSPRDKLEEISKPAYSGFEIDALELEIGDSSSANAIYPN